MDLTSSVRTDTLPAVASVLVPGAAASSPYAAVLLLGQPELRSFLHGHEATALVGGLLLAIGTGFLLESIGSYLEYYVIDWRHANRSELYRKWWRYLRTAWSTEPIGQHYLRRMLAVFKFELNGCVGTLLSIPGVVWLSCYKSLDAGTSLALIFGALLLALYLFHASCQTSLLLADIRSHLLLGVGEPPFDEFSGAT